MAVNTPTSTPSHMRRVLLAAPSPRIRQKGIVYLTFFGAAALLLVAVFRSSDPQIFNPKTLQTTNVEEPNALSRRSQYGALLSEPAVPSGGSLTGSSNDDRVSGSRADKSPTTLPPATPEADLAESGEIDGTSNADPADTPTLESGSSSAKAGDSKLVAAARALGIGVPDVTHRRRNAGDPYSSRCGAWAGGVPDVVTLDDIAHYRIALITVEYHTPLSMANSLASWQRLELPQLIDDNIMFLNAPLLGQVTAGVDAGFRVLTTEPAVLRPLLAKHNASVGALFAGSPDYGSTWGGIWPITRTTPEGESVFPVTTALLLASLDTTADLVIFLEKDFALSPKLTRRELIRSLLATVALLQQQFQIVRLRRLDDPTREAIPNCCTGECGATYSNFAHTCDWSSMMNWLKIFCDADNIEESSRRNILKCLDEGADKDTAAASGKTDADAPITSFAFSFEHSGWSNNAVAYDRQWWIRTMGGGAVLSASGMDFEINHHLLCDRRGNGQTPRDDMPMQGCQLGPGLFDMTEVDG